jgi:outer membrane lipoprotein LolB
MRRVIFIGLLLIASGCATQRAVPINDSLHFPSESWSAQGRIGITGVPQSGSASFDWTQRGDVSHLQLRGPIGMGSMTIDIDDSIHVTTSNGAHYDAENALKELESRLGVAMPVKQMRYWLRGMAAPGSGEWQPKTPDGNHAILDQDGWHIEFELNAQSSGASQIQLPRKINASHEQIRIKVVVQGWFYNERYF